ncbi:MAG: hypothetical protein ABI758_03960 [Candidatus Woesebacteria bacterium]
MKNHRQVQLFFLGWIVFFFALWKGMLVVKPDGLYAGHPYVWADWSMHIGLVNSFAYRPLSLWFSSHPFFAGAPLNYPFVINLISGILIRLGVSLSVSMLLPSFLLSLGLLATLYFFYKRFFTNTKTICIAALLFLCSGGVGFALVQTFSDSTVVLTKIPEKGIEFTNIIMGMLVPQRAFLLGLPIGLWLLSSIIDFTRNKKPSIAKLVGMGLVAGLLPIIHTHTYIVVVLFSAWVLLYQRTHWREWIAFGTTSAVVSALVYLFFLRSSVSVASFFSWQPGWYVHTGILPWMLFWLKNWGVFLVLALIGTYLIYIRRRVEFAYISAWWMIFILANLIQFQPQSWDNSKLFAWVYVGLGIPAAYCLYLLWRTKYKLAKVSVCVLVFLASLSGGIDLLHMLDFSHQTFRMLSADEISLGTWVREHTTPDAVFVTPELVSNPIPMMSGRSVVMGYSGWVFSYGFPYTDRQREMTALYSGDSTALDRLQNMTAIQYVYIPHDQTKAQSIFTENVVFENPAGKVVKLTK